ncbi:hypothetical protein PYCC9005_003852 [Savitreella phatthalungensis]
MQQYDSITGKKPSPHPHAHAHAQGSSDAPSTTATTTSAGTETQTIRSFKLKPRDRAALRILQLDAAVLASAARFAALTPSDDDLAANERARRAASDIVRRAFRRAVLRHHPDRLKRSTSGASTPLRTTGDPAPTAPDASSARPTARRQVSSADSAESAADTLAYTDTNPSRASIPSIDRIRAARAHLLRRLEIVPLGAKRLPKRPKRRDDPGHNSGGGRVGRAGPRTSSTVSSGEAARGPLPPPGTEGGGEDGEDIDGVAFTSDSSADSLLSEDGFPRSSSSKARSSSKHPSVTPHVEVDLDDFEYLPPPSTVNQPRSGEAPATNFLSNLAVQSTRDAANATRTPTLPHDPSGSTDDSNLSTDQQTQSQPPKPNQLANDDDDHNDDNNNKDDDDNDINDDEESETGSRSPSDLYETLISGTCTTGSGPGTGWYGGEGVGDDAGGIFTMPCRCGGSYIVSEHDLERNRDLVNCDGCSLVVKVLYRAVD